MSMSSYVFVTSFFFFFNDTATTEIYTLSLHDALPISGRLVHLHAVEVGMADHELRLHRLARGKRLEEPYLDVADVLQCLLLVRTRRRRTSAGRLDEPGRREKVIVARLGHCMHVGISVHAHTQ